ncbi:MAG TPA: CRTAC1 family protein [Thermoanaerobaculia bacterium]|nr:CRTAC1 family protein [Thermoanaerobaculia bacterium]
MTAERLAGPPASPRCRAGGPGRAAPLAAVSLLAALCAAAATVAVPPPAGGLRFEEVGAAAGARFVHRTRRFGDRPKAQVLEMFTAGGAAVAVGDYDGDGWEDLFLTDSGEGRPHHLLRNVTAEAGRLAFREVTAEAGVGGGNDPDAIVADALWLDVDADGRRDLLVARFGTPLLHRNLGGGRFEEVSAEAGLTAFANTIAAIAFDADGDGFVDLVFGNYFQPENLLRLDTTRVLPEDLDDAANGGGLTFWRNVPAEGGGRAFVDATGEAGLAGHTGWSLDLGHGDLDGDGDQDLYVAGDYGTDRLFWNDGDGTFTDGTEAAIGFDTRKGMNVETGDYDRDGRLDVFVTNITDDTMRECNMLWHNRGDGTFVDVSRETGTCDSDWGWAGKLADLDNDGWEDLFTVNGLRSAGPESYVPLLLEAILVPGVDFADLRSYPDIGDRTWSGYQRERLFRNLGGTFVDVAAAAGVDADLDGRGVGVADLDRDGRLDLVQTNADQPSLLYRNVSTGTGHWVALELVGTRSNREAIGARVTLTAGGVRQVQEVDGGNGYASQSSLRLHFGLGAAVRVERIEVRWPSGLVEVVEGVEVDRSTRVVEGEGKKRRPPERAEQ